RRISSAVKRTFCVLLKPGFQMRDIPVFALERSEPLSAMQEIQNRRFAGFEVRLSDFKPATRI
ncbi:hypothetical protein L6P87_36800, partial [Klebsiella pneumoniae]|nr:hypothetical protein [Klebsiella pneumoniae]